MRARWRWARGGGSAVAAFGVVVGLGAGLAGCRVGGGDGTGSSALVAATVAPTGGSSAGRRVAAASTTGTSTSSRTAVSTTGGTTSTTSTGPTVVAIGPCLTLYGPGRTPPIIVNADGKTVTMSWWHNGDPAAIAYWVGVRPAGFVRATPTTVPTATAPNTRTSTTAASGTTADTSMDPPAGPVTTSDSSNGTTLTEKPITWIKVPPPVGCRPVTFTVPGVVAGVDYSLWLEFDARTPELTPDHARVVLGRVSGVHLR